MSKEIWIVPFFGQGHLFPSMELSKHIASRNFKSVFVISSDLSSSVPDSLRRSPLVQIAEIPSLPPGPEARPGPGPPHDHHNQLGIGLEKLLSTRISDSGRPVCAIVDIMMDWTDEIFKKFEVPTVAFFTSGACSAAMELAMWRAHPLDLKPGEVRLLPGLPEEMALTYENIKQRPHGPPGGPPPQHHGAGQPGPGPDSGFPNAPPGLGPSPDSDFPTAPPNRGPGPDFPTSQPGPPPPLGRHGRGGPPKEGDRPPWVEQVEQSIAAMINTCEDLEHPFLEYIANQMGKPVWGVGPLLPEQYWKSVGSIIHDRESRTNRRSNVTEDEVIQWLDSKPRGSVLYVAFGSEVGPSVDEFAQLADALEASNQPFIWVIQPGAGRRGPPGPGPIAEGYFPHGLDSKVGPRGLIIHGWAPQLLILSHPSTGGFLSHCGWNSTVEAIGRGVPFLAWPIRGDQYHDAKLVVAHLKVGYKISDDLSEKITKEDIVKGIEKLFGDGEMKRRAVALADTFQHGFPASSGAALDAFRDLIHQKVA
ncbi:hypothetical protein UlMin_001026 [Ulmus minor]